MEILKQEKSVFKIKIVTQRASKEAQRATTFLRGPLCLLRVSL